jgi:hypothetical protein
MAAVWAAYVGTCALDVENFTELLLKSAEPSFSVVSSGEATAKSEGNALVTTVEFSPEEEDDPPVLVAAPLQATVVTIDPNKIRERHEAPIFGLNFAMFTNPPSLIVNPDLLSHHNLKQHKCQVYYFKINYFLIN